MPVNVHRDILKHELHKRGLLFGYSDADISEHLKSYELYLQRVAIGWPIGAAAERVKLAPAAALEVAGFQVCYRLGPEVEDKERLSALWLARKMWENETTSWVLQRNGTLPEVLLDDFYLDYMSRRAVHIADKFVVDDLIVFSCLQYLEALPPPSDLADTLAHPGSAPGLEILVLDLEREFGGAHTSGMRTVANWRSAVHRVRTPGRTWKIESEARETVRYALLALHLSRSAMTPVQYDISVNRLLAASPERLQSIGNRHNLSREAVRQQEEKILSKASHPVVMSHVQRDLEAIGLNESVLTDAVGSPTRATALVELRLACAPDARYVESVLSVVLGRSLPAGCLTPQPTRRPSPNAVSRIEELKDSLMETKSLDQAPSRTTPVEPLLQSKGHGHGCSKFRCQTLRRCICSP